MKPSKKERATMTKDELLRAVWLLDEYIDLYGWHIVTEDGYPKDKNQDYGYWCKLSNDAYRRLRFDLKQKDFYTTVGMGLDGKIYISSNVRVVAWQRITELKMTI